MDADQGSGREGTEGKRHELGLNGEVSSEHAKPGRSQEVSWFYSKRLHHLLPGSLL